MLSRRLPIFVPLLAVSLVAPSAGAASGDYRDLDRSLVALNVLPPGQGRYLNALEFAVASATGELPPHFTDQKTLYDGLVRAAPNLTENDLQTYFKDASFGFRPGDAGSISTPRSDVKIVRDTSFGVPHVYGSTRAGTMFGAGYVSGEDRFFMMDTLRHLSRGRLSEFLGASEANLAADRAQRLVADYTDDELLAMGQRLLQLDPELGSLAVADLNAFTDGVNAYLNEMLTDPRKLPVEYPALQLVPQPWKLADSISLSTLIGGQFSVGGGGQLANARFLDALEAHTGDAADAREIFDDFRNANDPEAPTSTGRPFPFNAEMPDPDPAAVARPDHPAQLAAAMDRALLPPVIDGPFGEIRLAAKHPMSNALLVSSEYSESGNPIAVMGPQVGYYSPEILMEIDLQGPGVHARGSAFPGLSLYVLLGRGAGYAWSATTAIGDHGDIRASKLCEPSGAPASLTSTHYEHDGRCLPLYQRTDSWLAKPSAGGVPEGPTVQVTMPTERTLYGIVVHRGTVGGAPTVFSRQRSSYGREVDATLSFVALHDPSRIGDLEDLMHAFGDWFSFSFNWHLITDDEVGFYTTGRYPVLAHGVDPDLPFWGDSRWDPVRYLRFEEHPQAHDPAWITNWNNKQAPSFRAADDWFSYGSVQRKMLREDGIGIALRGDHKISLTELTQAMAIAATRDLQGAKVLPYALEILGETGEARFDDATLMLGNWIRRGAHRRDLNGDGAYEDAPAIALKDAFYAALKKEVFATALGPAFDLVPIPSDEPGVGGSAYLSGWESHLSKDLRTVLAADEVRGRYSRVYCGRGNRLECRAAIGRALDTALRALEQQYGRDPASWDAQEERDAIGYSAVGVQSLPASPWQNRPTFQQVLEFGMR